MRWPGALRRAICVHARQMPDPLRARFYVDGFNLFHGIKEHSKGRDYRWLDLGRLAEHFLLPGHHLENVKYFTAIPPWDRAKALRHETYIAALESIGVVVVRGRFQKDERLCFATCGELFTYYTEKLTDVNLSTAILTDGVQDLYDWAYLISGDADQAPTIRALNALRPDKGVRVVFPPRRPSAELQRVATSFAGEIGWRTLKHCQLPDTISVGTRIIQKPARWAKSTATAPPDSPANTSEP